MLGRSFQRQQHLEHLKDSKCQILGIGQRERSLFSHDVPRPEAQSDTTRIASCEVWSTFRLRALPLVRILVCPPEPRSLRVSSNFHRCRRNPLTRGLFSSPPPVTPEDLVKLGVDPQLIPFIISTTLQIQKSPDDSPPLSPVEAEILIEALDKVRPTA